MLTKFQKRFSLALIALIVSIIIWNINASWNNTFITCFILSTTTFLIIYTPFEIYWSFRDIWFERWDPLSSKNIESIPISIKTSDGPLHGELFELKKNNLSEKRQSLVIVAHGFSDTKESLQYFYLPLVINGFTVFAYDARGIGNSKKTGKRNQFIKRINDFQLIIDWIQSQEKYQNYEIHTVGFSIGATTVINGGFHNTSIGKIIAISAMANYRECVKNVGFLVHLSYALKGVNLSPTDDENEDLSPYLRIQKEYGNISEKKWEYLSSKILLIHCQNDRIIDITNFQKNSEILSLKEQNKVLFAKGGHSMKKNECALVAACLRFLD